MDLIGVRFPAGPQRNFPSTAVFLLELLGCFEAKLYCCSFSLSLAVLLANIKAMRKVLVFGTFDVLHPGHIDFLKQAREKGDFLSAVVSRDFTVEKIKKHRPLKNEKERLKDVRNISFVGEARLGGRGEDPYSIIREIKPDIICLGYDQKTYTDGLQAALDKLGLKTEILRMKPFCPEKYHSGIINRRFFKN